MCRNKFDQIHEKSHIEVILEKYLGSLSSILERRTDYILLFPHCLSTNDIDHSDANYYFLRFRTEYIAACKTDNFIKKHSDMLKEKFSPPSSMIELIEPADVFIALLSTLLEEQYSMKFKEITKGHTRPSELLFILENSQDFEKFSILLKQLRNDYSNDNQKDDAISNFSFFNKPAATAAIYATPIVLAAGAYFLSQRK